MSKSAAARKAWETRRSQGKKCSGCGAEGVLLYEVQPIHPERDLCIDCGERVITEYVLATQRLT